MSAKQAEVIVLGAGVVGVACAYYLALQGYRVTVLERSEGAGLGTSFANGGLLTPSMADPWAAPGLPLKLLRWLGSETSPFLLRLRALPGAAAWGLRFLRECTPQRWRENAEIIYRLSAYSQRATTALTQETGIRYARSDKGTLRLFRDELSIQNAQRNAELVAGFGCRYEMLDPAGCVRVEPALAAQPGQISGGIYFPDDASGDAHLFTRELAAQCERLGVTFCYGRSVQRIDSSGGEITGLLVDNEHIQAERYVLALGVASPALLRPLGLKLPVYPVKGYSVTVSVQGWNGAPTVPLVDDARKMGITRLGDRLRLAGTAELIGYDTRLNPRRGQMLIDSMTRLFPGFNNPQSAQHWAGLRPMTPDGIPVIGTTPYRNLYLNTGQGHLGFTMACGSGKIIADLIAGNAPDFDVQGIGLQRF